MSNRQGQLTMTASLRLSLLLALGAAPLAMPAAAQDADTAVNLVYITSDERCPASTDEVITVCGVLEDQYRIPRALRQSGSPANTAWAQRVREFQTVGDFGTMSCSPAGLGGATGCTQKLIDAAYRERAEGADARFGQLIERQRAERLSTIDSDAAAEQARVEQLERAYMERIARESAEGQAAPGTSPSAPATPPAASPAPVATPAATPQPVTAPTPR